MQLARYEELAAVSSMKARVELVEWKSYMLQIAAAPANCRVRVMKQLAALFREASTALHAASGLADEILALANQGIQRAEPLSISQFLVSLLPRIDGMAVRAGRILNKGE